MALSLQRIGCILTHRPLIPTNVDKIHVGTELLLSYSTDFSDKTQLILNNNGLNGRHLSLSANGDDITAPYTEVYVETDRVIYLKYRLLFDSKSSPTNLVETFEASDWSRISSTSSRDTYNLNSIILTTPQVFLNKDNKGILEGKITFRVDGYTVIRGTGNHSATSWIVEDKDGNVIFKREKDVDNKMSIDLDYNLFEKDNLYFIRARFHNELGGVSNLGTYIYNPDITALSNFTLRPILPFCQNQTLYFELTLLRPNIRTVGIVIKENKYDSEIEVYRKDNITPSPSIALVDANLTVGKTYSVYIFSNYQSDSGSYTSPLIKSCTFTYEKPVVYPLSTSSDYPGTYGDLGRVNTGNIIVNTVELKNGLFVMAGNSKSTLCLYGRYGNTIRKTKIEFDLPFTAGDEGQPLDSMLPYINIIPMYNDFFAINYSIFGDANYKKSYWAFYKIDLVNNVVRLVGDKAQVTATYTDEYLSTAVSSSAVVTKNNVIYYIPAGYKTGSAWLDLPLFKLELIKSGDRYEVRRTKVINTIKAGIKHHMTMCPKNVEDSEEEFIILGGTNDQTFNETTTTGGTQQGVFFYKLSNIDVFSYRPHNNSIRKICQLTERIGNGLAFQEQMYNLAAYRRLDGKIVIFNNSHTGLHKYDTASWILDVNNLKPGNNQAVKERNETRVDIPFRSTIRMKNGDFVRFSYAAAMYNRALLYSHTPLLTYTDAEVAINKNLVVRRGELITVENLYIYDTVVIEGTSMADTGKIRWNDKNVVRVLDFRDKIFTRSTEISSAEYAKIPSQHLVTLAGVELTIKDK